MSDGLTHFSGRWDHAQQLHAAELVRGICRAAPLRRPSTPGSRPMRVRITSAGVAGWWADSSGYRYIDKQPDGKPWPSAPLWLLEEARSAAVDAGVPYTPDAVLVNWYAPTAFLSTHRDESEDDLEAPIVSFSLGAPAPLRIRGPHRDDRVSRTVILESGDCFVMGMPARNWYHEVPRISEADSMFNPLYSPGRVSILIRKVRL